MIDTFTFCYWILASGTMVFAFGFWWGRYRERGLKT